MRLRLWSWSWVVVAAGVVVVLVPPSATAERVLWRPPGGAAGGVAVDPQSQVDADTSCVDNSVLLFSARGSGDAYGASAARNKIGSWTQAAGNQLAAQGWNVRDLQAMYPAPPVP